MKKYNNSMYHSLHCSGRAKVRAQSCSEEYDKLFIAASTTEGQPRVVLTDALKNTITLFIRAFITEGQPRVVLTAALRNMIISSLQPSSQRTAKVSAHSCPGI